MLAALAAKAGKAQDQAPVKPPQAPPAQAPAPSAPAAGLADADSKAVSRGLRGVASELEVEVEVGKGGSPPSSGAAALAAACAEAAGQMVGQLPPGFFQPLLKERLAGEQVRGEGWVGGCVGGCGGIWMWGKECSVGLAWLLEGTCDCGSGVGQRRGEVGSGLTGGTGP